MSADELSDLDAMIALCIIESEEAKARASER